METTLAEEKRRYGTIQDFNLKTSNHWEKLYVFVLKCQNATPSVEGRHYPNNYSLKLEGKIFDRHAKDKNGKVSPRTRTIRVVQGEVSIYKDEQTEDGQKLEPIRVEFSKDGVKIVEAREELVLEYMLRSNLNETNPERDVNVRPIYGLLDLKTGLQNEMEKDMNESKAANWCHTIDFKYLIRYARVLGVDTTKDPDEIRYAMRYLAKLDPKKFNNGLENKLTLRKFDVLQASDDGLVKIDLRSNAIYWENGNLITHAPIGKSPVDHFVDLSMSDSAMDLAYRTMAQQVNANNEDIKVEIPVAKVNISAQPQAGTTAIAVDVNTPLADLVDAAIKSGVAVYQKPWIMYNGKKFMGKNKFAVALENDALLKDALIKACSAGK